MQLNLLQYAFYYFFLLWKETKGGSVCSIELSISRTSISFCLVWLIKYLCCVLEWTGLKIVPAQTRNHYSLNCRLNVSLSKAHRYEAIHSYSSSLDACCIQIMETGRISSEVCRRLVQSVFPAKNDWRRRGMIRHLLGLQEPNCRAEKRPLCLC